LSIEKLINPEEEEERCKSFNLITREIAEKWLKKTFDQLSGDQLLGEQFKPIIELLRNWDFKTPEIVSIISAQNGIGKTHLAVCLFKRYCWENYKDTTRCYFRRERQILSEIQSCYRDNSTISEEEVLYKYVHCKFLAIDDFFSDRTNEFARRTMLHILDMRSEWHGYPTVLTSNLSLEEISQIDTRIASRINNSMRIEIASPMNDFRQSR